MQQLSGEEVFNKFPKSYQDDLVLRQAELDVLTLAVNELGTPEQAARTYYDNNPNEFATACVSHILVADEAKANEIKGKLAAGEDFGTLARAESIDDGSKATGGDLGCDITPATNFVDEFKLAVFTQPVGEVGAPVQTQFGYHLVKVTKRDVAALRPGRRPGPAAGHRRRPGEGAGPPAGDGAEVPDRDQPEVRVVPQDGRVAGRRPARERRHADSDRRRGSGAGARARRDPIEPVGPAARSPGGRVLVVGLGPAGPDQLTVAAVAAIDRVPPGRRFLRTVRHPAAVALGEGVASFDRMYDRATTLDDVYPAIVEALVEAAAGVPAARCCTRCRGRRWWRSGRWSCSWPTPG